MTHVGFDDITGREVFCIAASNFGEVPSSFVTPEQAFRGSNCLYCKVSGTLVSRPLVRLCSGKNHSSPRAKMNGKHTAAFLSTAALARSPTARSHKV
jgi:hypothetical protein